MVYVCCRVCRTSVTTINSVKPVGWFISLAEGVSAQLPFACFRRLVRSLLRTIENAFMNCIQHSLPCTCIRCLSCIFRGDGSGDDEAERCQGVRPD